MNIFFDTSSLVRFYYPEEDNHLVESQIDDIDADEITFYLSDLAHVEFAHAFMRKAREGILTFDEARDFIETFERNFENDFSNLEDETENAKIITYEILDSDMLDAQKMILKHKTKSLKSLDAIQLATAVSLKKECEIFQTADDRLTEIFKLENLESF